MLSPVALVSRKCRDVSTWSGRRRAVSPAFGVPARWPDRRQRRRRRSPAFPLKGKGQNLAVGTEPWGVAVVLGSIPFVFGLGFAVWAVRHLEDRRRIYVVTRALLYLILGIGLVAGHWMPFIGVASIAFFFAGAIAVALARQRILGAGRASA